MDISLQITWIYLLMYLFHIVDDFVLQPVCLSKLKQKQYWVDECNKHKYDIKHYKYDYIVALLIHALSWSIMITLPFLILSYYVIPGMLLALVLVNTIIHALSDHFKVNELSINLCADQWIHMIQINITFLFLLLN